MITWSARRSYVRGRAPGRARFGQSSTEPTRHDAKQRRPDWWAPPVRRRWWREEKPRGAQQTEIHGRKVVGCSLGLFWGCLKCFNMVPKAPHDMRLEPKAALVEKYGKISDE